MALTARERELMARHLLAHPEEIPVYLKSKRWTELAALVEFARNDAPASLTHTDPALYRTLRQQITEFRLRGWSCLNLKKLKELAINAVSE
jgi:hypothetical protein